MLLDAFSCRGVFFADGFVEPTLLKSCHTFLLIVEHLASYMVRVGISPVAAYIFTSKDIFHHGNR
jgi:hypothetical protein